MVGLTTLGMEKSVEINFTDAIITNPGDQSNQDEQMQVLSGLRFLP